MAIEGGSLLGPNVTWPREPYALHTHPPTHSGIMWVDFGAAAMAHTIRKDTMCCWLPMRGRQPLFNTWIGNRRGSSNHLSDKVLCMNLKAKSAPMQQNLFLLSPSGPVQVIIWSFPIATGRQGRPLPVFCKEGFLGTVLLSYKGTCF